MDTSAAWCPTEEKFQTVLQYMDNAWGTGGITPFVAPSLAEDEVFKEWIAGYERLGASPRAAMAIARMTREIDIRHILPAIRVPALVMHRTDDNWVSVTGGRYIGSHIPGARYIELPGPDHVPWVGNTDAVVDDVEEFLTGSISTVETDRVLATVLFTDIVGSTEKAAALGDRRWRDLLDNHHATIRRNLERFRGREVKTTGDGILATFDGPARGVRCACAIDDGIRPLGIDVRAGLHTGECEMMGDDVGGIAVHIGARVASLAGPREVLVSNTVKDLVAGSGLRFNDRGSQTLKGVPGEWHIFAVER
jgi:class 3 adenylate cyclase